MVDDVAHLAVENCLISKLPGLFTPETVAELSDEDIRQLAAESQDTMAERDALLAKHDVLSKGLTGLKRLTRHHPPIERKSTAQYQTHRAWNIANKRPSRNSKK